MSRFMEEQEVSIKLNKETLKFLLGYKIDEDWHPVINKKESILMFRKTRIRKKIWWNFH